MLFLPAVCAVPAVPRRSRHKAGGSSHAFRQRRRRFRARGSFKSTAAEEPRAKRHAGTKGGSRTQVRQCCNLTVEPSRGDTHTAEATVQQPKVAPPSLSRLHRMAPDNRDTEYEGLLTA